MTGNEYQEKALRTWRVPDTPYGGLITGALGLSGESGEVADHIKKFFAQGHELDRAHIAEEIGDVLYYVAVTAHEIGIGLDAIMEKNIDKLLKRYPRGFEVEKSVNRDV